MAGNLQELAQTDFSGGVNAVPSPYLVGQKQVSRIRNLLLGEHGALSTRDGYSIVTTSPDLATPVVYRGALNQTNGASFPFAIQANNGAGALYRTDTTPWIAIVTSGYGATPQSVTVVDQEFVARGNGFVPLLYVGTAGSLVTALAGQTVPPGAAHCAFHLGYVWIWNTNPATTTLDGPSSLRTSDANNPNSWPNANQTFISKDDGQVGMGLAEYTIAEAGISPSQTLIAFKNQSAYQITGVFGSSNFSIQKIKSDMGCVAPRTIQFAAGFGIIRLTHRGFALFNGVNDLIISEEIRPYILGHDDITGLNFPSIGRSWATQSQNPPLYVAACPTSSNNLTRFFVYDLIRKAWSVCDFPIDISCLSLFTTPSQQPVIHAGTSSTGQIIQLFAQDSSDNGSLIPWSFTSRPYFMGSYMRPTFWRRLIVDMLFPTPSQAVTVNSTLTGLSSSVSKTMTFAGTGASATYDGSSQYDSGAIYDGASTVDGRQDVSIMKTAPSVRLAMNGSGNVRIRGLVYQARSKPLTKAVL